MADKRQRQPSLVLTKKHPISKERKEKQDEMLRKIIFLANERIERSKFHPIYLLDAHRFKEEWKFIVLGVIVSPSRHAKTNMS